jgi:alpha-L-arabinofuranosidase
VAVGARPHLVRQHPRLRHGSYYVQALFSRNRPDVVLPLVVDAPPVPLPPAINASTSGAKALPAYRPAALPALYAVAGRDNRANEIVIFIANPYAEAKAATIELRGVARLAAEAKAIVLTSASPDDENSFEAPMKIAPREETVAISGPSCAHVSRVLADGFATQAGQLKVPLERGRQLGFGFRKVIPWHRTETGNCSGAL